MRSYDLNHNKLDHFAFETVFAWGYETL